MGEGRGEREREKKNECRGLALSHFLFNHEENVSFIKSLNYQNHGINFKIIIIYRFATSALYSFISIFSQGYILINLIIYNLNVTQIDIV